jgi:hypothetical protein
LTAKNVRVFPILAKPPSTPKDSIFLKGTYMALPPLPEFIIAIGVFTIVGTYAYILHWFGSKEVVKHHSHSILAPSTKDHSGKAYHDEELRHAA